MSFSRFLKNASPLILTLLGAAGVVGTAVLAVKAVPKADALLEKAKTKQTEALTLPQKALAAAPAYLPAIGAGAATLMCIFGANALNQRQQASLASALGVVTAGYHQYRDKVVELFGVEGDMQVVREINKDNAGLKGEERTDIWDNRIFTFYEYYYGETFEATKEQVFQAIYHFTRNMNLRNGAGVNELHKFLGLTPKNKNACVGWSLCDVFYSGYLWFDISVEETTLDDGTEVMYINLPIPPTEDEECGMDWSTY